MSCIVLLTSCASHYIEPTLNGNEAVLKIQLEKPFEYSAPFGMGIEVRLDGKRIDTTKYPDLTAHISPGKHAVAVGVTAYYFNRAKHHFTDSIEIDFKPKAEYVVTAKVSQEYLASETGDVSGTLYIRGEDFHWSSDVTLKDSAMRSVVCVMPRC